MPTTAPFRLTHNNHVPRPNSQMASPFEQHFDTNYVPTSRELDTLKVLAEEEQTVIDAIDAEIVQLTEIRATHARRVGRHRALASPVRRLPDDIVLAIFFEFLTLAVLRTSVTTSTRCSVTFDPCPTKTKNTSVFELTAVTVLVLSGGGNVNLKSVSFPVVNSIVVCCD